MRKQNKFRIRRKADEEWDTRARSDDATSHEHVVELHPKKRLHHFCWLPYDRLISSSYPTPFFFSCLLCFCCYSVCWHVASLLLLLCRLHAGSVMWPVPPPGKSKANSAHSSNWSSPQQKEPEKVKKWKKNFANHLQMLAIHPLLFSPRLASPILPSFILLMTTSISFQVVVVVVSHYARQVQVNDDAFAIPRSTLCVSSFVWLVVREALDELRIRACLKIART